MGDEGRTSGSAYSIAWFYLGPFIAASATALRLYVRITKVGWKKLAIDDFLVSLSTVRSIPTLSTIIPAHQ